MICNIRDFITMTMFMLNHHLEFLLIYMYSSRINFLKLGMVNKFN